MADNRFTAGNPIVLEVYTGGANSSGRYRVSTGVAYATVLFEGTAYSFTGVATVDISDLFSSLRNTVGVMAAKMEAIDQAGDPIVETGDEYAFEFAVYGGGISDMLLRKLAEATTNIFDFKLKNNSGNFLLSTRTNARILYIPETELAPLKYYAQGLYVIVRAGNIDIATYDHTSDASESVATIDLAALRLQHWTESGELVNSFEIKDALEAYCMTVVITEAMPATYKLKFRNSWGVDEYLAIEGDVDYTPTPDEVTTTMRHDTVVGKLVTYNDRKRYNAVFEAQLGMKDINGRFFVMDALMSDSVYLCVNNVEYACRLSADVQMLDSTRSEPLPVSVKIELLDKAAYAGNLLNMAALTGVFDEEFSEEFE
jgi:hypothetical protein